MEHSQSISRNYRNPIFGDSDTAINEDKDISYKRSALLIRGLYHASTKMNTPRIPSQIFERFICKLITNKGELSKPEIFKCFPDYAYNLSLLQQNPDYLDLVLELKPLSENLSYGTIRNLFNILPKSAQYLKDNVHNIVQTTKEKVQTKNSAILPTISNKYEMDIPTIAATMIQKNAKRYIALQKEKVKENKLLIGPAEKKLIAAGTKELFKDIKSSHSAITENRNSALLLKNKQYHNAEYLQYLQQAEYNAANSFTQDFRNKYSTVYYSNNLTQPLVIEVLSEMLKNQTLFCCDFAMINAMFLNSNEIQLAVEAKKQIYVCQIGGHWVCCIGDPNNLDSIIIDSWIGRFIDFYPIQGYRDVVVPSQDRAKLVLNKNGEQLQAQGSGIITSVGEYVKFLNDNPSFYIQGMISPDDIKIHWPLSNMAKTIKMTEISCTA